MWGSSVELVERPWKEVAQEGTVRVAVLQVVGAGCPARCRALLRKLIVDIMITLCRERNGGWEGERGRVSVRAHACLCVH